jgi:hypothetical protein
MNSCRKAQSPLGIDLTMCSLSELHPPGELKMLNASAAVSLHLRGESLRGPSDHVPNFRT